MQENRRRNTILIDEHFSAIEKELEELINGTMAEFLVSCIDENKDIPLDVQIEIAFKELDVDNSGGLTVDELFKGMKNYGMNPTESELRTIMNFIDTDGDGYIDHREFSKVVMDCFKQNKFTDLKYRDVFFALSLFNPREKREILFGDEGHSCTEKVDLDHLLECLFIALSNAQQFHEVNIKELQNDLRQMKVDYKQVDQQYTEKRNKKLLKKDKKQLKKEKKAEKAACIDSEEKTKSNGFVKMEAVVDFLTQGSKEKVEKACRHSQSKEHEKRRNTIFAAE